MCCALPVRWLEAGGASGGAERAAEWHDGRRLLRKPLAGARPARVGPRGTRWRARGIASHPFRGARAREARKRLQECGDSGHVGSTASTGIKGGGIRTFGDSAQPCGKVCFPPNLASSSKRQKVHKSPILDPTTAKKTYKNVGREKEFVGSGAGWRSAWGCRAVAMATSPHYKPHRTTRSRKVVPLQDPQPWRRGVVRSDVGRRSAACRKRAASRPRGPSPQIYGLWLLQNSKSRCTVLY